MGAGLAVLLIDLAKGAVAAGLGLAWTVASYAGVPELAKTELAKSASRAGFEVEDERLVVEPVDPEPGDQLAGRIQQQRPGRRSHRDAVDAFLGPTDPDEIATLPALTETEDEEKGSGGYGDAWRLPLHH